MLELTLAGETVHALPEKALYWPREGTLFITDPHWGKAASLRARAMPIPDPGPVDLFRLSTLLERLSVRRLIFLGDLLHAKAGRTAESLETFGAWRARFPTLEMLLVRGNHDRRAGDPPDSWNIRCVDPGTRLTPFILQHEPPDPAELRKPDYALAGHLHPGAMLTGAGRQHLQLPCFWFGARIGVLPAFGSFTGTAAIRPHRADRVIVIAGHTLIDVSPR